MPSGRISERSFASAAAMAPASWKSDERPENFRLIQPRRRFDVRSRQGIRDGLSVTWMSVKWAMRNARLQ
jgi:hypothetical protein